MGTGGKIGWGWNRGYGVCAPKKSRIPTPREIYGKGDIIKVVVKKKMGSIDFYKNGTFKGTLCGIDFPHRLLIAVSNVWPVDFELIEFNDHKSRNRLPDLKIEDQVSEDMDTRVEFVVNCFSDFLIEFPGLMDRESRLFKLPSILLSHSPVFEEYNNQQQQEEAYKKFGYFLDRIEASRICKIVMNRDPGEEEKKMDVEEIGQYYLFFKHFKMRREMMFCLTLLERIMNNNNNEEEEDEEIDMKNIYDGFCEFCKCYESEDLKSLLFGGDGESEDMKIPSFDTSFSLFLFLYLLRNGEKLKKVIEDEDENILLKFIKNTKNPETISLYDLVLSHEDFQCSNLDEFHKIMKSNYFYECIQKRVDNNNDKNIIELETSDEDVIKTFKEFATLHFNFFHRMFQFGGKEVNELEESGKIRLMDLEKGVLKMMFDFYYQDSKVTELKKKDDDSDDSDDDESIEDLISLIIHCEQFLETEVLEKCITKLEYFADTRSKEEVKEALMKIGYKISSNYSVKKIVVPALCLSRSFDEETLSKYLRKSNEKNQFLGELVKLKEEVIRGSKLKDLEISSLRNENKELKHKVSELEKRIEVLEKKMKE